MRRHSIRWPTEHTEYTEENLVSVYSVCSAGNFRVLLCTDRGLVLPRMKPSLSASWIRLYAGLVGAMDFVTGLALVAAPSLTLGLMGANVPGGESLPLVRLVGVFVGAVGSSYLVALRGTPATLRAVLGFTLLVRASVGTFTGVAVAVGMFDRGWLMVSATDLGCAVVQAWLLWRKGNRDA